MSVYTQILYHLVFGTRDRTGVLDLERHGDLCEHIADLMLEKNCIPWQLGGNDDHIHILFSLPPDISLAPLVRGIKLNASRWIYDEHSFVCFEGWQVGFAAFSCSWSVRDSVMKYIASQLEYHESTTFEEEYISLLQGAGIEFDESQLWSAAQSR